MHATCLIFACQNFPAHYRGLYSDAHWKQTQTSHKTKILISQAVLWLIWCLFSNSAAWIIHIQHIHNIMVSFHDTYYAYAQSAHHYKDLHNVQKPYNKNVTFWMRHKITDIASNLAYEAYFETADKTVPELHIEILAKFAFIAFGWTSNAYHVPHICLSKFSCTLWRSL